MEVAARHEHPRQTVRHLAAGLRPESSVQIKKNEWWRRGESEYSWVLKTRKLLISRPAKNAQNHEIASNWNVSGTRVLNSMTARRRKSVSTSLQNGPDRAAIFGDSLKHPRRQNIRDVPTALPFIRLADPEGTERWLSSCPGSFRRNNSLCHRFSPRQRFSSSQECLVPPASLFWLPRTSLVRAWK